MLSTAIGQTDSTANLDPQEYLTRCGFDPNNVEKIYEAVTEFFEMNKKLPTEYIQEHSIRCSNGRLSFVGSTDRSQEKMDIIIDAALQADMSPKNRDQFNRYVTKIYSAYGWERAKTSF